MFKLQTADRLAAACVERSPRRNAAGEIVLLNVGLLLSNESRRPLAYEILRVSTEVEGCSGVSAMAACETRGELAPLASRTIDQGLALDGPLVAGTVLRGTIQATVLYGAPHRLDETLELDFGVSFKALSPQEISVFRWSAL